MANDIPIFKVTIDEEYSDGEVLGIEQVAFTSKPAILVKGMAFNSHTKVMQFADEPKMRIVAPAMIPMDIYRNDEEGEYYVQFSEQEIETIYSDFMQNLNNKNLFNLEHDTGQTVPAYILESWIVENPKSDKAFSSYGIEVPKGTLMLTAQITDKEYYNKLVESEQLGFSIEGFLGLKLNSNQIINNSMKLPDGEHLIEGKIYVVKDGEVVEVKDAPATDTPAQMAVVEEEVMTEDVVTEEAPVEEPVKEELSIDPTADAEAILAIVMPTIDEKYNELIQLIAEVKAMIPTAEEEAAADVTEQTKLTAHEKLMKFNQFNKD
jgi:hypothetical protein